ncbi:MAG: hypothetical protein CVT49_03540 [candidate division Zixibacteria bacterium HGW-Zixibacteria-1]|nr:MAG: hypothetical protein CVT49_03540 [candidate division Zixibacteria bacterium HGW-Zixibacteria-1]
MTTESPFFLTKVECPICKTINEYETIKVGAYSETDRDTDFCPTNRTWRNPRYQAYNPLLFFVATCSNCFYTREFNNRFKDWKNDAYFKTYRLKTVKERHLEMLAGADSVIKAVGSELDIDRFPNETAVLKLLLAVIDEKISDTDNNLDLARYYLRIGWIFREMEHGENPNVATMKGYLSDVDGKLEGLKKGLFELEGRLNDISASVASQFDDSSIPAAIQSSLYPIRDRYNIELASFKEVLSILEGKSESLGQIVAEHRKLALGTTEDGATPGFHSHRSFYDFLSRMAAGYEGIPLNERDALKLSVQHYKKAFQDGRNIAKGNQQIQASYLIAELSRRIGENQNAKEYFNTTIRTGQEFIYKHKGDPGRTALARKILELALEQGRANLAEVKAG